MEQYSIIILLLTITIGFSAVAFNQKIPYPVFLLLGGIGIGFIPGFERLNIDPEVIFLIFLPPLLCDAAFNISCRDFISNIRTITNLAIPLVFITTLGIAIVAHYCIPDFSWPLAFVLGAILSPTDAVSALSITKGSALSARTRTIIEGESLVNDASALIAYQFAKAAVAGSLFVWWKASLEFLVVIIGGCLIGTLLGWLFTSIIKKFKINPLVVICLNLLLPFVAYLLAEEWGVSGVLAVVTFGLFISLRKKEIFSDDIANQSKSIWNTITFLLNGLIFILIGIEFPHVLKSIPNNTIAVLAAYSFLISFVALFIRVAILFINRLVINQTAAYLEKKHISPTDQEQKTKKLERLEWRDSLIIGWSGMRGIVSLATALGLPVLLLDGSAFPHRDTILFLTVTVVLIMLIIQGLGFPWLMKILNIKAEKIPEPSTGKL